MMLGAISNSEATNTKHKNVRNMTKGAMKKALVCSKKAETKLGSTALLGLSWKHVGAG